MINFDLKDRVAVVTGGAQGFGLAITERFIASGASVVIWDIDEEAIKIAIVGSALSTTKDGAQESMPYYSEIEEIIV